MRLARLLTLLCVVFIWPLATYADDAGILLDYVPQGRIVRFEDPVQVWLGGEDRLEGKFYVETVVSELRRIIPTLSITQTSSRSQANVRVYLTDSQQEWRETIAKTAEGMVNWQEQGEYIRGFTRLASGGDGRIRRADIVLHLDFQTSGGQKLWVVRHEFMHALGITSHPKDARDSVLNSMQAQEDKNGSFSDSDILVLQTIYSPHTSAGRPL